MRITEKSHMYSFQTGIKRVFFYLISYSGIFMLFSPLFLNSQENSASALKVGVVYRLSVLSNINWTDTGLDVLEGQEIVFKASGGITLQKGNPMAYCNPEGYSMKTVQQPLKDRNIGALIGKIVKLISIEIDEETGEEIRNEQEELFFIGLEQTVEMPLSGRLFLGINEVVVGDNAGEFKVELYLTEEGNEESLPDKLY